MLYDFQAKPENIELMTFVPHGLQPARQSLLADAAQLRRDGAAAQSACRPGQRCSYGFMGRSPDHLASALVGQRMGIEVFEKHSAGAGEGLRDYFEEASRNDYFLTYVIINPQAERAKDWGAAEAKSWSRALSMRIPAASPSAAPRLLGTSSIMANEVFVANLQPLKPGEEDLAFSCALPMNTKGLRVLSRKSYEARAVSVFDNPLSSRFDENDALIYFDDVKVPWERVFVYRDTDMCRAQFHDTRRPHLSELPVADPPVGEDQVPRRPRAPHHRGDRHHQHAADPRAARHAGGASQHGQRHDRRHGGGRLDASANGTCRTSTSCIRRRC